MGRFGDAGWVALSFVVACSSVAKLPARRTADAGRTTAERRDAGIGMQPADANAYVPACDPDPTARVTRQGGSAFEVPWGAEVVVAQGMGTPPLPSNGTLVPGSYQLVSETLYGSAEPNTTSMNVGDRVNRTLSVDCDVAYEVYTQSSDGLMTSGNNCRRLAPRPLGAASASGVMGPGITARQDQVAYTARGDHLTLVETYLYWDRKRISIIGSYTYVSDFVLVSNDAPGESTPADGGATAPTTEERDPRCPAAPPSDGDPCSPEPSPIECEYGGDAFGQCATFAECALSNTDRTFRFQVDAPGPCTPPNPKGCPATFAATASMPAPNPDGSGPTCHYAEGVCDCVASGGFMIPGKPSCHWMCRDAAGGDGSLDPGCPWPRPLAGDRCPVGLRCNYDGGDCATMPSLGPGMLCQNGYWAFTLSAGVCF